MHCLLESKVGFKIGFNERSSGRICRWHNTLAGHSTNIIGGGGGGAEIMNQPTRTTPSATAVITAPTHAITAAEATGR